MCHRTPPVPPTRPFQLGVAGEQFDNAPLSTRQLIALNAAAARELTWGLPTVAREVARWRRRAREIPDAPIREDALGALSNKRGHIDGAALFSTIPRHRNANLIRLLVAYEIIWDFLDSVNERGARAGQLNGRQLHLALVDALDPARPTSDYYRHHPWQEDGGYLDALVTTCRENCALLPSYDRVREMVVREATKSQVCAINHDLDTMRRDAALEAWASEQCQNGHDALWFELTAAASTDLTIFALLALASEPACTEHDAEQTTAAYFPWASALAALLDSYVDQVEDAINGDHSYVSHYLTPEQATERMGLLMQRCLHQAGLLKGGQRHTLIVACMFALYLSKDSALAPTMRDHTRRLVKAGGSLTSALHPVLRLWRTLYGLRAA